MNKTTMYIVTGQCGEYDDYRECFICITKTKEDADKLKWKE